ncbi:MAG: DUF2270 domain-containing protein [Acidobacteriota bacterium]
MAEGDLEAAAVLRSHDGGAAFHTAMAHLYRAEMHRMTVWRQRLDVTTNWAFLLTMGLTTFTLGSTLVPHYIMLLGLAAVAISILIEARRYRHLHHSQWRLHTLEHGYFSRLLKSQPITAEDRWRKNLACDLEKPRLLLDLFTACRLRLRRNYLLLIYFMTAVWLTKIFVHPENPKTAREFHARFAVGGLFPPWFVVITSAVFIFAATLLALTCPSAEVVEGRLYNRCTEAEPSSQRRLFRKGNADSSTEPAE